jgi:serine protease Do
MTRNVTLAIGVPAVLLACLALGPGNVRAGGKGADEKRVERSVNVVRIGDGAFLGVSLEDVEADARGAKVRSVEEASPAEKAGIKEGDVIVGFDGETVRSASQLARLVRETPPGRSVAVEVSRGGARQKLTATLGEGRGHVRMALPDMRDFDIELPEPKEPPEAPLPPSPHAWSFRSDDGHGLAFGMLGIGPRKLGIEYMEMGEQLAAFFKLSGDKGVLVTSVEADGPAAKAGMKAGDVILKFDGDSVTDAEDLRDAVHDAKGGQEVTVTVQRDGRPLDLKVTPAKPESGRARPRGVTL